jgi:hypothetical protein
MLRIDFQDDCEQEFTLDDLLDKIAIETDRTVADVVADARNIRVNYDDRGCFITVKTDEDEF